MLNKFAALNYLILSRKQIIFNVFSGSNLRQKNMFCKFIKEKHFCHKHLRKTKKSSFLPHLKYVKYVFFRVSPNNLSISTDDVLEATGPISNVKNRNVVHFFLPPLKNITTF